MSKDVKMTSLYAHYYNREEFYKDLRVLEEGECLDIRDVCLTCVNNNSFYVKFPIWKLVDDFPHKYTQISEYDFTNVYNKSYKQEIYCIASRIWRAI